MKSIFKSLQIPQVALGMEFLHSRRCVHRFQCPQFTPLVQVSNDLIHWFQCAQFSPVVQVTTNLVRCLISCLRDLAARNVLVGAEGRVKVKTFHHLLSPPSLLCPPSSPPSPPHHHYHQHHHQHHHHHLHCHLPQDDKHCLTGCRFWVGKRPD